IIISSTKKFESENMITVPDFEMAVETALNFAEKNNIPDIFLCGGAEIYRQGMEIADRMYLTEIDSSYSGNVFFPKFSEKNFILASRISITGMSFCIYERIGKEL
ncbi:MAG: dihydrofolate reductase, partial [Ruminococcus sp.]|nr:dihydrofolate reductase [Ruminococcus sp.]